NGIDVEPLRPYVRALEDPALPVAQWTWLDSAKASIVAALEPGELISVQETYSPGWHASVAGRPVRLTRDALGLMTIDPACTGVCKVTMYYDGGFEGVLLRILSWSVLAGLIAWVAVAYLARVRRFVM
ncbi:MAG: hypothetical protein JWO80_3046, partial [Bryobacterales bacterium]|nr:hypothetical protein [Bryobacterales bacterium]